MVFYGTNKDFEIIRCWINSEPEIAWIIKVGRSGSVYNWLAVDEIEEIENSEYTIWHKKSCSLNIPSRKLDILDTVILDPFKGWSQMLDAEKATRPYFGGNLPGPYVVHFAFQGKEKGNSIGRSEFFWQGDYFKSIGKPADPDAKRWWQKLKRFLRQNSNQIKLAIGSVYVLPDAYQKFQQGVHLDVNP